MASIKPEDRSAGIIGLNNVDSEATIPHYQIPAHGIILRMRQASTNKIITEIHDKLLSLVAAAKETESTWKECDNWLSEQRNTFGNNELQQVIYALGEKKGFEQLRKTVGQCYAAMRAHYPTLAGDKRQCLAIADKIIALEGQTLTRKSALINSVTELQRLIFRDEIQFHCLCMLWEFGDLRLVKSVMNDATTAFRDAVNTNWGGALGRDLCVTPPLPRWVGELTSLDGRIKAPGLKLVSPEFKQQLTLGSDGGKRFAESVGVFLDRIAASARRSTQLPNGWKRNIFKALFLLQELEKEPMLDLRNQHTYELDNIIDEIRKNSEALAEINNPISALGLNQEDIDRLRARVASVAAEPDHPSERIHYPNRAEIRQEIRRRNEGDGADPKINDNIGQNGVHANIPAQPELTRIEFHPDSLKDQFKKWRISLSETDQQMVDREINAVRDGKLTKALKRNPKILEIRAVGASLRIYATRSAPGVLTILSFGDKDSQTRDIDQAIKNEKTFPR